MGVLGVRPSRCCVVSCWSWGVSDLLHWFGAQLAVVHQTLGCILWLGEGRRRIVLDSWVCIWLLWWMMGRHRMVHLERSIRLSVLRSTPIPALRHRLCCPHTVHGLPWVTVEVASECQTWCQNGLCSIVGVKSAGPVLESTWCWSAGFSCCDRVLVIGWAYRQYYRVLRAARRVKTRQDRLAWDRWRCDWYKCGTASVDRALLARCVVYIG